ncbi:MAG: sodium:calcium antiporter [Desulfobacteraceae bacterium]|nr:MAG: sodium:calcium antiporter [Desulfobacteraceae bacterium]
MKAVRSISMIVVAFVVLVSFTGIAAASDKATKEECVEKTKAAAQMVKEKGLEETLKVVQDKKGPFVWKDTYVFCIDMDKQCNIAHPITPTLVGKNLMGVKDPSGKLFFAEFINTAREKGEGWVDYMWPKVGEKNPSPKITYVYRVPDHNIFMAAGIYE